MPLTEEPPTVAELDHELADDVWNAAYELAERLGNVHLTGAGTPIDGPGQAADVMAAWIARDPQRAAEFLTWAQR